MELRQIIKKIWPEWELKKLIGQGQYGKVYRIEREKDGTVFESALKVIEIPSGEDEIKNMKATGMDMPSIREYLQDLVQSLKKETDIMQELKSSVNVVTIEDSAIIEKQNQVGWTMLIRMELLDSLPGYMKNHTMMTEDYVRLGKDICSAIADCKKSNIIHRDIKPENIFADSSGTFKLGDFGIARKLQQSRMTMSSKGTELYMAPEVIRGDRYDATVDIYSLGIMLYRFLNKGRMPFYPPFPDKITPEAVEQALLKKNTGVRFPAPCEADETLTKIILKACAYNPSDRYQKSEDMIADLQKWENKKRKTKKEGKIVKLIPLLSVSVILLGLFWFISNNKQQSGQSESTVQEKVENKDTTEDNTADEQKENNTAVHGVASEVFSFEGKEIIKTATYNDTTAVLTSDGEVILLLSNGLGEYNVDGWKDIIDVSAGYRHIVGLKSDGTVVATGRNESGECDVQDWTDIIQISAGYKATYGLKSDGTVVAVGSNDDGRCEVDDWTGIKAVSVGRNHGIGLRTDGTVLAVGDNMYGQCNVQDWKDITQIAAGSNHTVGLKSDGTVVAAGRNNNGECELSDWTEIKEVSAGWHHTVGLKKDGTVVARGKNNRGQCNVENWSDITAVTSGYNYTTGLNSNGLIIITKELVKLD